MEKLQKEFFAKDTEQVAKNLLGKVIKVWNKYWIITETEAYKHNCDEASHAYWKKTSRNALMYDTYWFVYVYLIYGIHYCLNFTSDKEKPGAVLIRWVKQVEVRRVFRRCQKRENLKIWGLINWPGRVTKFFGIDKSFNWLDLEKTDKIQVLDAWIKLKNIQATPRIWISKAKDKLWRFVVELI